MLAFTFDHTRDICCPVGRSCKAFRLPLRPLGRSTFCQQGRAEPHMTLSVHRWTTMKTRRGEIVGSSFNGNDGDRQTSATLEEDNRYLLHGAAGGASSAINGRLCTYS
ncbi:hypothetical protein EYF80_034758 [Liparis tanakae]|uniref:Uncharacterized protein n=1 Tax=Liparis tanakae TaxID=230148 RepID=A0A4Z2GQR5_9TELE|nr:hypothetical protein EYF80_034758 [Liparis tanakae]